MGPSSQSARVSAHRAVVKTLSLLIVAGLLTSAWHWRAAWYSQKTRSTSAQQAAQPIADQTRVPVDAATARRQSFPIYLNGLGVAQAWNTVTIRVRVDGQIDKINFQEGQMVNQGDLLLQIDPRPFQAALDQAAAKKALDEALLANSKHDLERYSKVGTLAVSQQQIDTQAALVKQQEAQVKADQGAIDNAQVQLGYTTITAPIAGRMGFRLVDRGNIVHANDQTGVAVITQIQPIAVVFTAPEEELPRINTALKGGPLPVTALTSDGKTELDKGTLALVDNQVDIATGSIRLKARFDNSDNKLWPGLTVATRLQVETLHDVVVVPDIAVQRGPEGRFAYVLDEANRAEMRKLDIGKIEDGSAVINRGIEPGERVVTSGYYRLQPGIPVEIRNGEDKNSVVKRSAARPDSVEVEYP